ncbi:G-protein coupled receptor 26-like [Amphiura filiformis]|uniref:G-protein coupled receptor 26-like n=1 Tax=Amphiura filiformis TaxID=82378 RepID=UPI003B21B22D
MVLEGNMDSNNTGDNAEWYATTEPTSWTETPIYTDQSTTMYLYEDNLETELNPTDIFELSTYNIPIADGDNATAIAETTTGTTNGLISPTSYMPSTMESANGVQNICAAVFIIIFIITSIVGNFTIIASLRHGHFKRVALYSLLSNLCVSLLCDSVLNMSLILGATVAGGWPYGDFLCQMSAFLLNVLNIETLLSLMIIVFDRLLATKFHRYYLNHMNRAKANILSGLTWIYSTGFTLAILIGPDSVPSRSFPYSYLCNITSNTHLAYKITVLFFCYFLPFITIFAMFVIIVKIGLTEKAETQSLNNRTLYGFEVITRTPLSDELRKSKSVGALCTTWCLLQGPYLVLHTVYTFVTSEDQAIFGSEVVTFYPPLLETTFAWMKFSYVTIAPIIIFISWSEAREELRNLVCHKSNVVDSGRSSTSVAHDVLQKPGVRSSWASTTDESISVPSTIGRAFQVPILLATADGLRLKVGKNNKETDIDENSEVIPVEEKKKKLYMANETLPPFGAVETFDEEEGAIPPSDQKRPSLTLRYNDSGYDQVNDYSSTFQLSINSESIKGSPRKTPVISTSPNRTSLPTSPRSLTSIEYF